MNTTLFIGIGLGGFALLLNIVGVAIPYWWVIGSTNNGLFRSCVDLGGTTVCAETLLDDFFDWWKATQAMMILSILAMGAGMVLALLFASLLKEKQIVALGAAFMMFAGTGLGLIGIIIFGAKTLELYDTTEPLHAGFGLCIVAAILALPAAIAVFVARNRNV